MTPEGFAEAMEKLRAVAGTWLKPGDKVHESHREADDLMCEVLRQLGYEEGVAMFVEMQKWYS